VSVVLDSSAVLAALRKEAGADVVRDLLSDARVSAVNLAEIVAVLARSNEAERVREIIREVGSTYRLPMSLWPSTRDCSVLSPLPSAFRWAIASAWRSHAT
jgi:uncharacterized protein with PIN domain